MGLHKHNSGSLVKTGVILGWSELGFGLIFIGLARSNQLAMPFILIGTGFLLWRISQALIETIGLPKRLIHIGLLFFFMSAWLGAAIAYDPLLSWPSLTALIGGCLFFYAMLDLKSKMVEYLTGAVVLAGVLFSLWFVTAYSTFDYEAKVGLIHTLGQHLQFFSVGTFGVFDRNAVASSLEGLFLLSLAMIAARHRDRFVWLSAAGLIGYGLLLTASRGSWISLALVIVIWACLRMADRLGRFEGGLVTVLALLGFAVLLLWGTHLANTAFLTSDSGRSQLFSNVTYLWQDTWLTGIGLGQPFTMVYSTFVLLIHVPFLRYAHNIFFQIGLGQGLLGLIGFGTLLIGLGIDVQASRSKILISDRPIFDAIWLGLTAVLLHGLVDATQFIEFLSLPPLFILMGLTTRLCLYTLQVQPRNRSLYGIGVSGVVVLLVVGLIGWKSLAADFYVNKAALTLIDVALAPELTEVEQAQRQDQARLDLQQALRYQPAHSGAQRWLGLIEYRQENFEAAIPYFRAALPIEADNYTIWKGLGYAYLWSGDVVTAKFFLKRVPASYSELGSYAQWWKSRGYPDRSEDASELRQLLTD